MQKHMSNHDMPILYFLSIIYWSSQNVLIWNWYSDPGLRWVQHNRIWNKNIIGILFQKNPQSQRKRAYSIVVVFLSWEKSRQARFYLEWIFRQYRTFPWDILLFCQNILCFNFYFCWYLFVAFKSNSQKLFLTPLSYTDQYI